ncbi:hypothetical protein VKT23_018919 [Stygiomarasmius scandens]|uniref:Uncharacterized protein n=1 Tax=Marasmiellus scandens TaxID=2682957 RepID=A0ABR1IN49_9AGAR
MPRPTPFVPKEPIEKLPLAVRKDVRDNYESQKADLEKQISDLLGVEFKVNLNPNQIWAYNPEGSNESPGGTLKRYVTGFAYCLKNYLEKYGEDGKNDFNGAVTAHEFSVTVNTLGDKAPTISCEIKDGVFYVLFHHQKLGYSTDYIGDALLAAIEAVPREGLSTKAKYSIDQYYDSTIDELQEKIGKLLGMPDVELEPSFEANFKALKAAKKDDNSWEEGFGRASLNYFEGFKSQLEYQGFKDDDMLQEGLAEQFTTKKVVLQVVDKISKKYHEVAIEEGTLYLRTIPDKWWVNAAEMGQGLVDLL